MPINGWDFAGWATKNDLKCSDGRVIRKNAFKVNDGQKVPLIWNHGHNSPKDVLGHAILENRDEGVYCYCFFNDTDNGQDAKKQVLHGDVSSLSIWANNLRQEGYDVLHGIIREVSLVLAGANPGAFIESVLAHGEPMEDYDSECIFYSGEGIILAHADEEKKDDKKSDDSSDKKEEKKDDEGGEGETVKEVYDSMTEKQKKVVGIIAAQIAKGGGSEDKKEDSSNKDDKKEEEDMKHNVFDREQKQNVLSHSDVKKIFDDAKRIGSLKAAVEENLQEGGVLAHALDTTGMETAKGNQTYGFNDADMLFPDYRSLNTPPDWISREMGWVQKVMAGVHHTPFSRIKSQYANIT